MSFPASNLLVNGERVDHVTPGSWALQGATVFTTVRIEEGQPIFWSRHLARLARHAEALGIPHPGDPALEADLAALRGLGPRLLLRLTLGDGLRLAEARLLDPPAPAFYAHGVTVSFTRFRVHPDLAPFKTGSYLPYHLARKDAEAVGAFEGMLIDSEGHVVDGSRTSPLLYRDGTLTVMEGGLEGITREAVAEEAQRLGLRVGRARLGPGALDGQLLLAGSGVGLVPVGAPADEAVAALIARLRPS